MNFKLTTPCDACPFSSDGRLQLWKEKAREIADGLLKQDRTFSCHKTTQEDEEGEFVHQDREQHCAGALIFLERQHRPNQMMRIAERCRLYDRAKLDMNAPVYKSRKAFIDAQRED